MIASNACIERLSRAVVRPRPPKPPYVDQLLPRIPPIERCVKRCLLSVVDRGWFGLTPLQTHVVVCGFPRSGTTLLQLVLESCYPAALTFGRERYALEVAQRVLRNHALMISKRPTDCYRVDEIRYFYEGGPTRACFVFCTRDPRDIFTSQHSAKPGEYYLRTERWRTEYDYFQYLQQFKDVLVVEFRDLVETPTRVQQCLTAFIGWAPARSFEQFHTAVPQGFDTAALNGVRPFDPSALGKWRQPCHHARICQILQELPEFPDLLIEMGYETDRRWVEEYMLCPAS